MKCNFAVLVQCIVLAIFCLNCGGQVTEQAPPQKSVEAFITDLTNKDVRVRTEAAQALGTLKDRRAIPALIEAYRDTRYESFLGALWALGEFQNDRVQPLLLDALKHDDWRARSVSAKLLDQRGWEPANREQRIRRLIALEKWQEAASTGPSAKPIAGRPNSAEGSFELDIPILIVLESPDAQEPKIATYPWLEFHETNNHVHATVELLIASWPKRKCTLAIDILGRGDTVLKHVEMVHTTSGVLEKYASMERERLHCDLGPRIELRDAAPFRFSIKFEKAD